MQMVLVLHRITFKEPPMNAVLVTSKRQVTIPAYVRRELGITPVTEVTFPAKNGVAHLQVERQRAHSAVAEGAGLIVVSGKT